MAECPAYQVDSCHLFRCHIRNTDETVLHNNYGCANFGELYIIFFFSISELIILVDVDDHMNSAGFEQSLKTYI